MKLVRWGPAGQERPGILDSNEDVRDLGDLAGDLDPESLAGGVLERLRDTDPAGLPRIPAGSRLGPCLMRVGDFHCVGLNYSRHAKESGAAIPEAPIFFSKASSTISGPEDPVVLPGDADRVDWEVELGVVIGRAVRNVSTADALNAVAGYCVVNDVSDRGRQFEPHGQWYAAKSGPTFGPIGPWLVTSDEVPDPQALHLWLDVNGERKQDGKTSDMIFSVAEIIAALSARVALSPGDLIATGTPEGVGSGRNPPEFLRDGDRMELGVDGLGVQRLEVR